MLARACTGMQQAGQAGGWASGGWGLSFAACEARLHRKPVTRQRNRDACQQGHAERPPAPGSAHPRSLLCSRLLILAAEVR